MPRQIEALAFCVDQWQSGRAGSAGLLRGSLFTGAGERLFVVVTLYDYSLQQSLTMSRKSKRNERRKRLDDLARERDRHRVRRIGIQYALKAQTAPGGRPMRNPTFHAAPARHKRIDIKLPSEMTIATTELGNQFFSALAEFRTAALYGGYRRVVLDFADVQTLSPEAAILMLAELQRCFEYCRRRNRLGGTYPKEPRVAELLINIGFYDAIKVNPPTLPAAYDDRTFVKVVSGRVTDSAAIGRLLEKFDEVLNLPPDDQKSLHGAILECMDNVREHAYAIHGSQPHLLREWWLVGYLDSYKKQASFIFYDQGMGIVRTITTFKRRTILPTRFPSWSDARWIERAVTKKISRIDSKRRGHGLPRLTQFITRPSVSGYLRVIANKGEYSIATNQKAQRLNYSVSAPGTIIVWSLSTSPDAVSQLEMPL